MKKLRKTMPLVLDTHIECFEVTMVGKGTNEAHTTH